MEMTYVGNLEKLNNGVIHKIYHQNLLNKNVNAKTLKKKLSEEFVRCFSFVTTQKNWQQNFPQTTVDFKKLCKAEIF